MSITSLVAAETEQPWLSFGERQLTSRLLVGIEQYESPTLVRQVLEASGCQVFITTMDSDNNRSSLLLTDLADEVPPERYLWVGTTSFARSPENALRTARKLRQAYGIDVLKLDVRNAANSPDNEGTIQVAAELRRDGMQVMPLIQPIVHDAIVLQDLGCAALRVVASPVGSGRGIVAPDTLRQVITAVDIPVVAECGIGTAHHVSQAMELGAAAVLVNAAVVHAKQPLAMAEAMRHAALAGRLAYLAGPMPGAEIH